MQQILCREVAKGWENFPVFRKIDYNDQKQLFKQIKSLEEQKHQHKQVWTPEWCQNSLYGIIQKFILILSMLETKKQVSWTQKW